jgi:PqqD family protein of HPr-rel-A system
VSQLSHLTLSQAGLVFDSRTGDSFQLNASAQLILNCLQRGMTLDQTAESLSQNFGITQGQALTDVLEFQVYLNIIGLAAA